MSKTPLPDDKAMLDDIAAIVEKTGCERKNLIPVLQNIQDRFLYLSEDAIKILSGHFGLSSCEIYGVATFYNQFRFNPPGKHQVKICLGTACHVKGGDIILENFERKLKIKTGHTTEDREFSIDKVACIGCCALAPAVVIDEKTHAHMTPTKIEGIFLGYEIEKEMKIREEKKRDDKDTPA